MAASASDEDGNLSTSEDDLDSVQGIEEDRGLDMGQIALYEGEPLGSSDDNGRSLQKDQADEDGLTAGTLEQ